MKVCCCGRELTEAEEHLEGPWLCWREEEYGPEVDRGIQHPYRIVRSEHDASWSNV